MNGGSSWSPHDLGVDLAEQARVLLPLGRGPGGQLGVVGEARAVPVLDEPVRRAEQLLQVVGAPGVAEQLVRGPPVGGGGLGAGRGAEPVEPETVERAVLGGGAENPALHRGERAGRPGRADQLPQPAVELVRLPTLVLEELGERPADPRMPDVEAPEEPSVAPDQVLGTQLAERDPHAAAGDDPFGEPQLQAGPQPRQRREAQQEDEGEGEQEQGDTGRECEAKPGRPAR